MELLYGWFERFGALTSADITVLASAVVLLSAVGIRLLGRKGLMAPLGLVWVMWITLGYFTARPVFPSLAMFAVLTLVAGDSRLRWAVVPLFWIWASVHGGFIVGLGYLVLQGLRKGNRDWAIAALAAAVASSLTAHGWAVWETLLRFAGSSDNLDLIREWRAPDLLSIPLLPFLLGIVALLMGAMNRRYADRDLWIIVPFLVFAFTANRAVPLAAIALIPFVLPRLANDRIGSAPLAWPVAWGTVVLVLAVPWLIPMETAGLDERFPVEAAGYLEEEPTFHDDFVGGYLIYKGFNAGVFIDDRAELYGDTYAETLAALNAEPGWRDLFEQYGVNQVLLRETDAVAEVLKASGWLTTFHDEDYVVMTAPGGHAPSIDRSGEDEASGGASYY